MKKFSSKELLDRMIWTLLGYFASLYGIVNLPAPGLSF